MSKIIQIIGTRPQYIKLVNIPESIVIDTGQHYSEDLVQDRPKVDIQLKWTGSLRKTIKELMWIIADPLMEEYESCKVVVVYGDTFSTFCGALAAKLTGRKLVHIEAGVRTGVKTIEERIRIKVDKICDMALCPTELAKQNVLCENVHRIGIDKNWASYAGVFNVGDIMYDRFLQQRKHNNISILTLHRRENLPSLQEILNKLPCEEIIFYVHPHTERVINEQKIKIPEWIRLSDPVSHDTLLRVISKSKKCYTDSGGLVKEAYWSGCPVEFIGTNPWPEIYSFGDGKAEEKIVKEIRRLADV